MAFPATGGARGRRLECAECPLSLRQKNNKDQLREIAVDQFRRLKKIFEGYSQHAAAAGGDGSIYMYIPENYTDV